MYPIAVGASAVAWILVGWIASRRATRNPLATWNDYWRHYFWMAAGILVRCRHRTWRRHHLTRRSPVLELDRHHRAGHMDRDSRRRRSRYLWGSRDRQWQRRDGRTGCLNWGRRRPDQPIGAAAHDEHSDCLCDQATQPKPANPCLRPLGHVACRFGTKDFLTIDLLDRQEPHLGTILCIWKKLVQMRITPADHFMAHQISIQPCRQFAAGSRTCEGRWHPSVRGCRRTSAVHRRPPSPSRVAQ